MTERFTAFDAGGREFQMPYMPPIDPDLVVFNDAGTVVFPTNPHRPADLVAGFE